MPLISNYIHMKLWDVITYPYPNFNSNLINLLLKIGHGYEITFHIKLAEIIHAYLNLSRSILVKEAPIVASY